MSEIQAVMDLNRFRVRRILIGRVRDEEIISVASSPATLVEKHAAASVDSGSRNRKAASEGDQADSEDVAQYLVSDSPPDSMTNVPQGAISDSDKEGGPVKCKHGEPARRKYCWDGANTGRYFYCCRRKEKPCTFIQWIDPEWAKPVKNVILTMWGVVQDNEEEIKLAVQQKEDALAALRESQVMASRASCVVIFTLGMMTAMLAVGWHHIFT